MTKPKTGDEKEYAKIAKMSVTELLGYVLGSPYLLCDSYYKGYDTAIYARHDQLIKESPGKPSGEQREKT